MIYKYQVSKSKTNCQSRRKLILFYIIQIYLFIIYHVHFTCWIVLRGSGEVSRVKSDDYSDVPMLVAKIEHATPL
jgi:hypothetical protein